MKDSCVKSERKGVMPVPPAMKTVFALECESHESKISEANLDETKFSAANYPKAICLYKSILIMVFARSDFNSILGNRIYQTMFVINSS